MAQVRYWRPSDLPDLYRMAAVTTWNITPEDDKKRTTFQRVAASAQHNVDAILRSPYGTAVVADHEGRPVGYLLVGIQFNDKTGEPHGYLADVYVEPAFRRQGISWKLHQAAEAYLRQIGIRKATNWTHAHNKVAQKTSEHHGMKLWGMMMVKHLRT